MARPHRPGRTLVIFLLGTAILYGLVAIAGDWKPSLGLDLRGGTRITLVAKGDPSSESIEQARQIIDQRVNGSGVAESEVTTQGDRFIVVEIPGENRRSLVDTVQRQAQLRFRLVACSDAGTPCGSGQQVPTNPIETPGSEDNGQQDNGQQDKQQDKQKGDKSKGKNRPPVGFDRADDDPADDATDKPSDKPSGSPSEEPSDGASPTDRPKVKDQGYVAPVDEELTWAQSPDQAAVAEYDKYTCKDDGTLVNADGSVATVSSDSPVTIPLVDDPSKPLVACSPPEEGTGKNPDIPPVKYLLSRAVIQGTDLDSASAGIPQNQVNWVVDLELGGDGQDAFTKISRELVGTERQFAVVLDGQVISAPTMEGLITNGQAQISGNFTETTAKSLATSLKYGSLPISFEDDVSAEEIGPSLAGNQLRAGVTAGILGLVLVMLYCLLYYRGLGLVVLASLLMAATVAYALVLLLASTAGFTLTLPGIAGLIIGVGVTADSFIIFFERIRDEMREGRSMRVAVETGWKRARKTRMAANVVSLLSAAVLYLFATGVVKGFGFALGLSTAIDLAILFWFTKPLVSTLARFRFFNGGGELSGLSPSTLGMDAPTVGGKA